MSKLLNNVEHVGIVTSVVLSTHQSNPWINDKVTFIYSQKYWKTKKFDHQGHVHVIVNAVKVLSQM